MKVKEYLQAIGKIDGEQVTFVIAKAVKNEYSQFYHEEYRTTPIRSAYEWLREDSNTKDYIVLNGEQPPIAHITTKFWLNRFNTGHLSCLLITTEEDIRMIYSEPQATDVIAMYDEEIRKSLNK